MLVEQVVIFLFPTVVLPQFQCLLYQFTRVGLCRQAWSRLSKKILLFGEATLFARLGCYYPLLPSKDSSELTYSVLNLFSVNAAVT
jgi:hypothetical protein